MKLFPIFTIVVSIFLGTSLWFTPNSLLGQLLQFWPEWPAALAQLTSAIQLGFVFGTLGIALSGFADRFAPHKIFAFAAIVGAGANAAFGLLAASFPLAFCSRFLTGVALAGVYPLGMKLVVLWRPQDKERVLSWLVAALTLGTALPHLLKSFLEVEHWLVTVLIASLLAVLASFMIFGLGSPRWEQNATISKLSWKHLIAPMRNPSYNLAVASYWGHMWELYAFWALVPKLLFGVVSQSSLSLSSFLVIASGAIGCVVGGMIARRYGSISAARYALLGSFSCCVMFPFIADNNLKLLCLFVWSVCVIADSPQFSALVAWTLETKYLGAGFALQNATGFMLTVGAIMLTQASWDNWGERVSWLLMPGPALGLFALYLLDCRKGSSSLHCQV